MTIDPIEHERRLARGLGAVRSLGLLDTLLCLPLGVPVAAADLSPAAAAALRAAPDGCVEWGEGDRTVRRVVVPAAEVHLVVVGARTWEAGLRRAAAFAPFARRAVLLDRLPRGWPAQAWDAVAAGVGVWVGPADTAPEELVAPAPFVRCYLKPAGWRFTERAYAAWLRSTRP